MMSIIFILILILMPILCSSYIGIRPRRLTSHQSRICTSSSLFRTPPDLPSAMLQNRVVFIGMHVTPAVTELVLAQLLYLNSESRTEPIKMYINSQGSAPPSESTSEDFETDVFAIADCMRYIRAPVHTTCIGQAHGTAAVLLSLGTHRSALPNASIMIKLTGGRSKGGTSDLAIRAREASESKEVICKLLAEATRKSAGTVSNDLLNARYFSPLEAVEYGLIDKVESPQI